MRSSVACAAPVRNRGFTMIELIVVMILIGILAAYATARLDVATFRERGFHDALKAGLQYARKAAVAKRRQVCVDATLGTGAVVTFTVIASAPETAGAVCPGTNLILPGTSTNGISTPTGVSLTAGPDFFFDALGRASASGITFSSDGQPDITVEQETGYVR